MSGKGYIQVHAYTSNARIPLKDVAISVTDKTGSAIAYRLTNRSGVLDRPIEITVPNIEYSQAPNPASAPFTAVNLFARLDNYELIAVNNLQVFSNTITDQDLAMIPLSEFPESFLKKEEFDIPAQNL